MYQRNDLAPVTQDVCLTALSAIGKVKWGQTYAGLAFARRYVFDFEDPTIAQSNLCAVNCWTTVLRWGVIGGGISEQVAKSFVKKLDSVAGANGIQKTMVKTIYERVDKMPWRSTSPELVPLGAMVYHGRKDGTGHNTKLVNPISHVTVHVGGNNVVGCWLSMDPPPELVQPFYAALNIQAEPDTLMTPITAFGVDGVNCALSFSTRPFWEVINLNS
jgi:hypothetical protein